MPKVREPAAWRSECDAVIVGIRTETATIEQIWLRSDGGISARGRVHYRSPGRTPTGEVVTSFGLSSFRQFSPSEFGDVRPYSLQLQRELTRGGLRVI